MKNLRHRGNQQRFGQTGNSNQKRMAASQDRDEHLIDDGFLPDDNFAHFGFDSGAGALELVDGLQVLLGRARACSGLVLRAFNDWCGCIHQKSLSGPL